MMITARRHLFKFHLTLILATLSFSGIAVAMIAIFIKRNNQGIISAKEYLMPLIGIVVLFMAFYTIFRYYKNAPKIVIEDNFISFKNEIFPLSEIFKIKFTGKCNFKYFSNFPMEAATVYFTSGHVKFIFDDMYQNSWEIKSYLKQVIIDKKGYTFQDNLPITKSELANENFEVFRGNQFISLRGFTLWGLIGFSLHALLTSNKKPTPSTLIFFTAISLFWFALHSWLMHYFKVSEKFVVVKNHLLPWKMKAFRLKEIKEIVFETRYNMPNCLRIITYDFKNKLYPAGTLRDKTWIALKERLESHGIKVRNECI